MVQTVTDRLNYVQQKRWSQIIWNKQINQKQKLFTVFCTFEWDEVDIYYMHSLVESWLHYAI